MNFPSFVTRIQHWAKQLFTRSSKEFKTPTSADHALVLAVTSAKPIPRWQQWRFIGRVLTRKEQRLFLACLLIALVGIMAGSALLIIPRLESRPAQGGTITEAIIGSPKLINPIFAPLNDVDRDLVTLIYSGLFRLNDQLEPEPDMALSYQWLDDGKTLQVILKPNLTFQDGVPLTAEDVVFTYQIAQRWHGPLASTFKNVTVTQVDDHTVNFTFDQPNPNVLSDLTLGIMPAHVWEEVTDVTASLADANLRPVGSGPYQATSLTRDAKGAIASYQLTRFADYQGQAPMIDQWKFQFYPDQPQALAALQSNQVDTLAYIPWGDADGIKNTNFRDVNIELPQETIAFFNVKDSILKDERIRKALAMAMDKTELQGVVGTHATMVDGPFPFLSANTSTPSDLEGARILLTSIGWTLKGSDTVRSLAPTTKNASSTQLAITLDVPNQPDLIKIADLLKRRWSLIGVHVDVRVDDAETLLRDAVTNRDYQVLLWNILLPANQDLTPFWSSANASNGGLNFSNSEDSVIDRDLAAVSAATSSAALQQARLQLSDAILAHAPALFLSRPAYAYIVSKNIKGVTDIRMARKGDRLMDAALNWYIKTTLAWK